MHVPSPEAVAKAMAAAVKNVILNPMSRAQGAKWLRQEARSFDKEQVNAVTLTLTNVISRDPTGYPRRMRITYDEAIEQGGKQLLPLLYQYGAEDMRDSLTGPNILWRIRAQAETRAMLPANISPPRAPPRARGGPHRPSRGRVSLTANAEYTVAGPIIREYTHTKPGVGG